MKRIEIEKKLSVVKGSLSSINVMNHKNNNNNKYT